MRGSTTVLYHSVNSGDLGDILFLCYISCYVINPGVWE